ncbi:unnamed protein product [Prorocentrum cordatum]|uniref:Uncharacterized protein n=1 Tax=Prorocentrum cordatum TaxID=2364126 RepID=A0ABN9X5M0_9DINO|nr:unnamed protein product [Polarella glacialis]
MQYVRRRHLLSTATWSFSVPVGSSIARPIIQDVHPALRGDAPGPLHVAVPHQQVLNDISDWARDELKVAEGTTLVLLLPRLAASGCIACRTAVAGPPGVPAAAAERELGSPAAAPSGNRRAVAELLGRDGGRLARELLAASPALGGAVLAAAEAPPEGAPGCEAEEPSSGEACRHAGAAAPLPSKKEAAWLRRSLAALAALPRPAAPGPPPARRGLRPPPLGAVRPRGWLRRTLELSAAGLAGRLFEFYPPVRDSGFLAGDLPYALNGLVPLAAATGEARLTALCVEAVARVLSTRGADGWLGPDEWPGADADGGPERFVALSASIWARVPLLQGLAQFAEAAAEFGAAAAEWGGGAAALQCQAFAAVEGFVLALARRLDAGRCSLVAWSAARWPDLVATLGWLLSNPSGPGGRCEPLSDRTPSTVHALAWLARVQGYDWEGWFADGTFPEEALGRPNFSLYSHGVNNAVAVKWGAAWAARFGAGASARLSLHAWRQLQEHHGVPSGAFGADEHLAGSAPGRGTELCVVVESLRSLSEAYAALPSEPSLADDLELRVRVDASHQLRLATSASTAARRRAPTASDGQCSVVGRLQRRVSAALACLLSRSLQERLAFNALPAAVGVLAGRLGWLRQGAPEASAWRAPSRSCCNGWREAGCFQARVLALEEQLRRSEGPEVQRRLDALVPFLEEEVTARRRGVAPEHPRMEVIIRNVAMHVFGLPMAQLLGLSFKQLNGGVQRGAQRRSKQTIVDVVVEICEADAGVSRVAAGVPAPPLCSSAFRAEAPIFVPGAAAYPPPTGGDVEELLAALSEGPFEGEGQADVCIEEVHLDTIDGQNQGADSAPQAPLADEMAALEPLDALAQHGGAEADQVLRDEIDAAAHSLVELEGLLAAATAEATKAEGGSGIVEVPQAPLGYDIVAIGNMSVAEMNDHSGVRRPPGPWADKFVFDEGQSDGVSDAESSVDGDAYADLFVVDWRGRYVALCQSAADERTEPPTGEKLLAVVKQVGLEVALFSYKSVDRLIGDLLGHAEDLAPAAVGKPILEVALDHAVEENLPQQQTTEGQLDKRLAKALTMKVKEHLNESTQPLHKIFNKLEEKQQTQHKEMEDQLDKTLAEDSKNMKLQLLGSLQPLREVMKMQLLASPQPLHDVPHALEQEQEQLHATTEGQLDEKPDEAAVKKTKGAAA